MADKENVPPVKKRRLSLSLSKNRFQKVSEEEVLEAEKGFVPSNTRRCNNWAFKNFCLWLANSDDGIDDPDKILLTEVSSEVSVREQTTTVVEKKEICEKIKNGLVENYGEMSGCTFNISLKHFFESHTVSLRKSLALNFCLYKMLLLLLFVQIVLIGKV